MSENLQKLLEEFVKEAGLDSIATGIIDFDGTELAYLIRGTFDKDFKPQQAASLFAMAINFLNKTLGGIFFGDEDDVKEILITSQNGYFLLEVIETEKCFHGVALTMDEDINKIQQLAKKYKPLFVENL